jgi:hypothetical protein
VDRNDSQQGEPRRPAGLGSQHDRPRVLAGVLDELAWRANRRCDGALEVAVMLAVEMSDLVGGDSTV